jgi:hypothetical protein
MSPNTCPHCGEENLVAGHMQSAGSVHFRPLETKFLTSYTPEIVTHASMCASCGMITLKGDADELRLLNDAPESPAGHASAGPARHDRRCRS